MTSQLWATDEDFFTAAFMDDTVTDEPQVLSGVKEDRMQDEALRARVRATPARFLVRSASVVLVRGVEWLPRFLGQRWCARLSSWCVQTWCVPADRPLPACHRYPLIFARAPRGIVSYHPCQATAAVCTRKQGGSRRCASPHQKHCQRTPTRCDHPVALDRVSHCIGEGEEGNLQT